jgi:CheY-like chemotaxis protein
MSAAKKILLVDDDVDFLDQIGMTLATEGYEVVTASSEDEAEEALLANTPDLCVLDLMMENQDSGFVLCHRIKKLYPGVPVILLTGVRSSTGLDFSARSQEAGSWVKADAFLDKPVRPEQLREEVKRLLAARE